MGVPVESNDWKLQVLRWKVGLRSDDPVHTLHLFVNDFTPSASSVVDDFTECALNGYAQAVLNPADWTVSLTGSSGLAEHPGHVFHFDGPGLPATTVYGWYLKDEGTGLQKIAWSRRLDTPYVVPSIGGSMAVTLNLTEDQG